ncbi:hypothetical protein ACN47E_004893 [Coniothyrium glycines]
MASPVHTYFYSMVEVGVVKFFVDHQIFHAIPHEENTSIAYDELAAKSGVDLPLLERFLNFLIAAKLFTAPSLRHVAHTESSKIFMRDDASYFYQHAFDYFFVSAARWPEYFEENGPAEPKLANRAPYGLAAGFPDKTLYDILEMMPRKAAIFNATMAMTLAEMPAIGTYDFGWIANYIAEMDSKTGEQRKILVDVGGGQGQILKAILEKATYIPPDRCVLEDQSEHAVNKDKAGVMSTVKRQVANFFEEQPVKGALVYHVSRVLNDWPDEACVGILGRLREACAPDSRVLVAENLLPDDPSQTIELCAIDLFMMNFGGKRRTQEHYAHLASRAGFRMSTISHDEKSKFGVIEMVPL